MKEEKLNKLGHRRLVEALKNCNQNVQAQVLNEYERLLDI